MTQEPSELIEADAEPGLGEVSVCFAGGGLAARQDRGGLGSPGDREGDEAEEQVELAGGDEPGVLEVEAAGLGVAEEALDGPALAVSREGGAGRGVGGDDEERAVVETPGGEVQPQGTAGLVVAESGAERADPAALAQERAEGEAATVLGCWTCVCRIPRHRDGLWGEERLLVQAGPRSRR